MWSGKNRVWMHYLNDIIAADVSSAVFLSSVMKGLVRNSESARYMEIIDLQQYRVIRKFQKVKAAISTKRGIPFVFVIGKN